MNTAEMREWEHLWFKLRVSNATTGTSLWTSSWAPITGTSLWTSLWAPITTQLNERSEGSRTTNAAPTTQRRP